MPLNPPYRSEMPYQTTISVESVSGVLARASNICGLILRQIEEDKDKYDSLTNWMTEREMVAAVVDAIKWGGSKDDDGIIASFWERVDDFNIDACDDVMCTFQDNCESCGALTDSYGVSREAAVSERKFFRRNIDEFERWVNSHPNVLSEVQWAEYKKYKGYPY